MASDFIVVGGGLVGASVAYGLLKSGATVTVLDEGATAFRAFFFRATVFRALFFSFIFN